MSVNDRNFEQVFQPLAAPGFDHSRLARRSFVNERMVNRILTIVVSNHYEMFGHPMTRNEIAFQLGVRGGNSNNYAHGGLNYCLQAGFIEAGNIVTVVVPTARLLERTNLGVQISTEYDLVDHMGEEFSDAVKALIKIMKDGETHTVTELKGTIDVWGTMWWEKLLAYMVSIGKFEKLGGSAYRCTAAMFPEGVNVDQITIDPRFLS